MSKCCVYMTTCFVYQFIYCEINSTNKGGVEKERLSEWVLGLRLSANEIRPLSPFLTFLGAGGKLDKGSKQAGSTEMACFTHSFPLPPLSFTPLCRHRRRDWGAEGAEGDAGRGPTKLVSESSTSCL